MNRPAPRLRRLGTIGAVALAGITALSGCSFRGVSSLPLPGGPDVGSDPRTVKVEFANVLDLVPHSVVKVNDVSVGTVDEIELAGDTGGWHALVTVKIRKDAKLPDNAVGTIGQTSLLGEKFVELSAPKNEPPRGELTDGDLIPLSRTSESAQVEEVLSAMSMLLNGGGIEQISTITTELNKAMDGRTSTIKSVLGRVDTLVTTLDRRRGSITKAIDSIDRLTKKLADERATIAATIDQTGPALKVLNQNRKDLTQLLVALDRLSKTTTNVIKRSKDDLLANLTDIQKILRNLNKAGVALPRNLGTVLTWPFPETFDNAIVGDYGNVRLTLDLDFESIAQNLFGGTALEGLVGSGKQMRNMLTVPNVTLPRAPLGVLPQDGAKQQGGGGLPGLPGLPGLGGTGGQKQDKTGQPTGGANQPRSMGRPGADLHTLMTGGLS